MSAAAHTALRSSHSVTSRCTAYTADGGVLSDLPFEGGSWASDSTSQVRRTASITISDPGLWPSGSSGDALALGTELGLEFGIIIPGRGTEWVPVIRGPIQSVDGGYPAVDALKVDVADRSKWVADDRMDAPTQTIAGRTCVQEISRLVTESVPGVEIIDLTGSTQLAPTLDIDKERWQDGVEKLGDALGAEVFFDPVGRLVIRPQPTLDDTPVWRVDAGQTGVLIKADRELTREQMFNAVIARGERSDGTPPVWAKSIDQDPDSSTFYGGRFGKKPRFYSSALLTTTDQCQVAGDALLARRIGMAAKMTLTAVPNPGLEGGDVVEVVFEDGTSQRHILDTAPGGFSPADTQALTTRSTDLPAEN